jgi:hypothetical protein
MATHILPHNFVELFGPQHHEIYFFWGYKAKKKKKKDGQSLSQGSSSFLEQRSFGWIIWWLNLKLANKYSVLHLVCDSLRQIFVKFLLSFCRECLTLIRRYVVSEFWGWRFAEAQKFQKRNFLKSCVILCNWV